MPLITISIVLVTVGAALWAIKTSVAITKPVWTLFGVLAAVFCLTVTDQAETVGRTNIFPKTLHIPVEVEVHNSDMVGVNGTGLWGRNSYAPEYWRISYTHDGNSTSGVSI